MSPNYNEPPTIPLYIGACAVLVTFGLLMGGMAYAIWSRL